MIKETSKQENITPPELRNPEGKGGFKDNPQNRSNGHWKPENTFSYQYRRFMSMSPAELKEWAKTPDDQRTVAMDLAFERIVAARKSIADVKEITDRTEGKAPQSIDMTTNGESMNPYAQLSVEELRKLAGK